MEENVGEWLENGCRRSGPVFQLSPKEKCMATSAPVSFSFLLPPSSLVSRDSLRARPLKLGAGILSNGDRPMQSRQSSALGIISTRRHGAATGTSQYLRRPFYLGEQREIHWACDPEHDGQGCVPLSLVLFRFRCSQSLLRCWPNVWSKPLKRTRAAPTRARQYTVRRVG
jgi:hypothetical protein